MSPRNGMTDLPSARMASGIGARSRSADRQQRHWFGSGWADHGQHVAPETAEVRARHRHHGGRGHDCIRGGSTEVEGSHPGRGGQLICRRHHAPVPRAGRRWGERISDAHRTRVLTARRPSAALRPAACGRTPVQYRPAQSSPTRTDPGPVARPGRDRPAWGSPGREGSRRTSWA